MATFTNKVAERRRKSESDIRNANVGRGGAEADVCREFGPENSKIQTIWRTEPKLLVRLNRTDRKSSDFESLYEVMSVWRCLIGLSKRDVTMYQ